MLNYSVECTEMNHPWHLYVPEKVYGVKYNDWEVSLSSSQAAWTGSFRMNEITMVASMAYKYNGHFRGDLQLIL